MTDTDAPTFIAHLETAFPAYTDEDGKALWSRLQPFELHTVLTAITRHADDLAGAAKAMRPNVSQIVTLATEFHRARGVGRVNGERADERAAREAETRRIRQRQQVEKALVLSLPPDQLARYRLQVIGKMPVDLAQMFGRIPAEKSLTMCHEIAVLVEQERRGLVPANAHADAHQHAR